MRISQARCFFLTGAGFSAWSANSNASVQLAAPDRLRGRIIGLYFFAFNGTGPLGGLMTGWLCARGGTELAFVVAGVAGLAGTGAAAAAFRRRPELATPRIADTPRVVRGGSCPPHIARSRTFVRARFRGSHTMTFVDPGVIGECDARTQGGSIVPLSGRPRTPQRAAERGRATQPLIV